MKPATLLACELFSCLISGAFGSVCASSSGESRVIATNTYRDLELNKALNGTFQDAVEVIEYTPWSNGYTDHDPVIKIMLTDIYGAGVDPNTVQLFIDDRECANTGPSPNWVLGNGSVVLRQVSADGTRWEFQYNHSTIGDPQWQNERGGDLLDAGTHQLGIQFQNYNGQQFSLEPSASMASFDVDATDPGCGIIISEDAVAVNDAVVDLQLFSSDSESGLNSMRLKNENADWGAWEMFNSTKWWNLSIGDGVKTVYVEYRDGVDNSSECTDTIILDTTAPCCSLSISDGLTYSKDSEVVLSLIAEDEGIGVSKMRFKNAGGEWNDWMPYEGIQSWVLSAGDGQKTVHAEVKDSLENAAECTDTIILDTAAPTCSLLVEEGATYSDTTLVVLRLYADDITSGVSEVRFRNDTDPWSEWEAFAPFRDWVVNDGDGEKTVYAELRDRAGNFASCSDAITLDATDPTCHIDINGDDLYTLSISVTLTLVSDDSESGIGYMRFKDEGGPWSAWETYAASKQWSIPEGDGPKTVYVEFRDNAGNVSQCYDVIVLETEGPSCSIEIDEGAEYATDPGVTLSLSAIDTVAGVSSMRFKNDGGEWSGWEAYGETKSWTLPVSDGTKTVYVEFVDKAGNTSQCSDDIVLDTTAPLLTLGVLQNPVLTSHLDIYLVGSEPLDSDCILVAAGIDTIPVLKHQGKHELYRGSYELTYGGTIQLCAKARDMAGLYADTCRTFAATHIAATTGGIAGSVDGAFTVALDPNDLAADCYVLVYLNPPPVEGRNFDPALRGEASEKRQGDPEVIASYTVSPPGLDLERPAELRFNADRVERGGEEGIGVFRQMGEDWIEISSHWDELCRQLVAFVSSFGTYAIGYKTGAPAAGERGSILLSGPFPNPFTSETRMVLDLPVAAEVEVSVFDAKGRLVRTLIGGQRLPGRSCVISWDGLSSGRAKLPAGVYLIRTTVGTEVETKRVVFAR